MAKTVSKIEQELLKILADHGHQVKDSRNRQHFLEDVQQAVDQLDNKGWASLSPAAQAWANAAMEAWNAHKEIDDFPKDSPDGNTAAVAADVADADAEEVEEEASAPAKPAKKATAKSAKASEKKATPVSAAKPKARAAAVRDDSGQPTIKHLIYGLVLKNPAITTQEVCDAIKAQGRQFSEFGVSTTKNDFLSAMRFLKQSGHLNDINLAA